MSSPVQYSRCETCGQQSYQWCTRCRNAWYCSTTHQQQDWARHSQECIPWESKSTDALAPRIDSRISHIDTTITGLLLPCNTGRPSLIPLRIAGRVDAADNTTDWAIPLNDHLGRNTAFSSREITRNVGGEPLRYPLRVFFRDNFLEDGSSLNRTVNEITHGNARHTWGGNIVVLKWSGARRQGYQNMSMGDLPVIAAWFLTYG